MRTNWLRFISGWLTVALVAFAVGCAHNTPVSVPPPPKTDWTVTVTFNYDFTNFAACSGTVTKGCVSGFTWGYLQGAVLVPLKTSPASICTGATQPKSCTDTTNAIVGIGPVTVYVVANGLDNSGNAISSTQDNSTPVPIAIGIPTGVSATFQ